MNSRSELRHYHDHRGRGLGLKATMPRTLATLPPIPSERDIRRGLSILALPRRLANPTFFGFEHLEPWRQNGERPLAAQRPVLFVGNHTLFGVLDIGFFVAELWDRIGILPRSLGDHLHFQIPIWRDLLVRFGVVDGTRENTRALFSSGQSVLVFPGGGREVAKRKGEQYKLIWKERTGFARLAIEHGATIVPFCAVGVEDALDVVLDSEEMFRPLGRFRHYLPFRTDVVMPIVKGIGPTPIPRPERLYFQVQKPIETTHLGGGDLEQAARTLRDEVKVAVEAGISSLQAFRDKDPNRNVLRGLFRKKSGV